MAKHCETFEHPADLGLAARADTLAELFEALGEGLADQICPRRAVAARERKKLLARSEDVESLAVEFLGELLGLFHLEKFLARQVRVERISESAVRAEVTGERYDPARHELGPEIKAVTYHQLEVARRPGGEWIARVILDL